VPLEITLFTDPACPFAFSAEPSRWSLRWRYGDQLSWHVRMIVLTLEPGEDEKLAEGAPSLQRRYGMPIHPGPYPRTASSEPACRAVVAVRVHAPGREQALLRRLRIRTMAGGLLDDPDLLEAAALDAGIDPAELALWSASDEVGRELRADIAAARDPSRRALALDHKLGGPASERRYSAPSYELARSDGQGAASIPGFNPIEAYETAIANLAPELTRRARPDSVEELLAWAGEPLATAEIAAVTGLDSQAARGELSRVARAIPVGADAYWIPAPR
jgi:2-hydroxychromene-2-carboxylate isomerase